MSTRLLQLASPALPIGAYSYSSGLEWGVESGAVRDAEDARRWIADALHLTLARFDAPLMVAAHRHWRGCDVDGAGHGAALARLNAQAVAARETVELRLESTQMGYSLARWIDAVCDATPAQRAVLGALDPVALPVAWALAAVSLGLDESDAALGLLWGFAENQVMVLMKALPMGQIAAQRLLLSLSDEIDASVVATVARAAEPSCWSSAAPGLALASMRHETQYSRLFRS